MEAINKTIKFNLYVIATPNNYAEEGELPFDITVNTYNLTEFDHRDGDILLETFEREIIIDSEYDLRGAQLENLKAEKAKMLAEHYKAVIALDDKINSLLAIEHES